MKEIYIKYNPYKLDTQVKIDNNPVKENSAFNIAGQRFQEWVEDLPRMLVDECNSTEFHVTFYGTLLDYEDLLSIAKEAEKQEIIITCEQIPAKEVEDKEQAIDCLFEDIKSGPFDELRQPDVVRAFELAKSSDFEASVVATMSAGKSTLINALLCRRLMPARHEACTATITKIKDAVSDSFRATVYDKSGTPIGFYPDLSYEIMEELNNSSISTIQVEGRIPFVNPDDVRLVLVDTPGPNNSRDLEHKAATYRLLSESSKALVLYILDGGSLGAEDDSNLLDYVAQSMSIGGRQSKDRFMFVVNKLDDYRKGTDNVVATMDKVKQYLSDKGIVNPNIFPAAALPALDIRTYLNGDLTDEEIIDEMGVKVRKFNRNEMLHLENYAPLPPSIRREISRELADAREEEDVYKEALIHTGIIPIEHAVHMYVHKYAKTAKVRNIVDTFAKKLESAKSFEITKQEIADNQDQRNLILSDIERIKEKLKSGEEVKKFKAKVDGINYDKEISAVASGIIQGAQKKVSAQISENTVRLTRTEAKKLCDDFARFTDYLQAEIQVRLEDAVTNHVQKNAETLLDQYKKKIADLSSDLDIKKVSIHPYEIMDGDIGGVMSIDELLGSVTKSETEKVVVGSHKQYHEIIGFRRWSNSFFGTDFHVDYDIIDDYDYVEKEYIEGPELAQRFFAPIQKQLFDTGDDAIKYAKEQARNIKIAFSRKFDELDAMLKQKLDELSEYTSNRENIEAAIQRNQDRLAWLEQIQSRAEEILEI